MGWLPDGVYIELQDITVLEGGALIEGVIVRGER
jgi:hypothetical protein